MKLCLDIAGEVHVCALCYPGIQNDGCVGHWWALGCDVPKEMQSDYWLLRSGGVDLQREVCVCVTLLTCKARLITSWCAQP